MKTFLTLSILLFVVGCSSAQINNDQIKTKVIKLDFEQCLLDDKEYNQIRIEVMKGFKKKKVVKHGFCEYQLWYKDSSVFYVSTDIYSGSRLNYENLYQIGIDTYAKSRSLNPVDTILNSGEQINDHYWLEYVMGDVVIGYVNVNSEKKKIYDQLMKSLKRVE